MNIQILNLKISKKYNLDFGNIKIIVYFIK